MILFSDLDLLDYVGSERLFWLIVTSSSSSSSPLLFAFAFAFAFPPFHSYGRKWLECVQMLWDYALWIAEIAGIAKIAKIARIAEIARIVGTQEPLKPFVFVHPSCTNGNEKRERGAEFC